MKRKREQKKGDGKTPFLPGNCGTRRCQLAANASVQIYTGRVCVADGVRSGGWSQEKKGGGGIIKNKKIKKSEKNRKRKENKEEEEEEESKKKRF